MVVDEQDPDRPRLGSGGRRTPGRRRRRGRWAGTSAHRADTTRRRPVLTRFARRPGGRSAGGPDIIGPMRVAILGFGLIGGSIARASGSGSDRIGRANRSPAAWSPGGDGPAAALSAGVVDAAPPELAATIEGAELVVLAAPPLACLDLIDELGGPLAASLGPDATVTDVASTKARDRRARPTCRACASWAGIRWRAARRRASPPRERDLFVGRPWVVVPRGRRRRSPTWAGSAWLVQACGAVPLRARPGDARSTGRGDQPPAAGRLGGPRRGRDGRRPTGPLAAGLAAGGWREHDPAGRAAIRPWRPGSPRRTPWRSRPGSARSVRTLDELARRARATGTRRGRPGGPLRGRPTHGSRPDDRRRRRRARVRRPALARRRPPRPGLGSAPTGPRRSSPRSPGRAASRPARRWRPIRRSSR